MKITKEKCEKEIKKCKERFHQLKGGSKAFHRNMGRMDYWKEMLELC